MKVSEKYNLNNETSQRDMIIKEFRQTTQKGDPGTSKSQVAKKTATAIREMHKHTLDLNILFTVQSSNRLNYEREKSKMHYKTLSNFLKFYKE